MLTSGRVYFPDSGNSKPRIKQYEFEDEGLVPDTWWTADSCGTNDDAKKQMHELFPPEVAEFSTPKPEALMQRIIQIATNEGDVVLDCFVGSGTTVAVAHKMKRRWIGVERQESTLATYTLPRLSAVVQGTDDTGISADVAWTSGGGFRVLKVAPSMFDAQSGLVFLSDHLTNGALAEATAAQLGYPYEPEPPFAGRRGRSRLAVIDGVVNDAVVRLLVSALGEDERVVICGTAIDAEARSVLRSLRLGSTMRKIPAALLERYKTRDVAAAAKPTLVSAATANGQEN